MNDLNQVEISTSNTWEQKEDDELRIDIEAMIQEAKEDPLSQTCCIYKVPRSTREKNENIYTPTTISIGPFHYGDPRLRDMERYKVIMLKRFIQRFMTTLSLDNLISFVMSLETKVRASYSEDAFLTKKEFQKQMLLDGAFIIELFLSVYHLSDDNTQNMDAILRQPKLLSDVTKDLLLLENQLPLFFLEGLYRQAFPADHVGNPSFADLSYKFFDSFNSQRNA
ncbi:hypothetical protein QN277_001928 [Acacia crassicarpa]|uniref:Uncharacterized protein n=1 Tax=Acacia crassicarpa TaxID=499986 RepID=A0AAE1THB7_9FABA|nr:hypothetical protein QN277_001928 [Acacia crassicarpa]